MSTWVTGIWKRLGADSGASLVESALLCALLIAVTLPGVSLVGSNVKCRMEETADLFAGDLEMPVQGEQTNSTMNLNSCRIRRPAHNRAQPTPTSDVPTIGE